MNKTNLMVAFRTTAVCTYQVSSGNRLRKYRLKLSSSRYTPVAGSYEHCNESSGFTVCEEFYWPRNK
jgi:hypothetical protein